MMDLLFFYHDLLKKSACRPAALVLGIGLMCLFSGCGCPVYHHSLDIETQLLIPYNKRSVLAMQDSTGRTGTLICRDSLVDELDANMNENNCVQDLAQRYSYTFHSDTIGVDVRMEVNQGGREEMDSEPNFLIGITDSILYFCHVPIGLCADSNLALPCQDHFSVGSRYYNNVLELELKDQSDHTSSPFPTKVWYVPYFGIVKMALRSGVVWELVD